MALNWTQHRRVGHRLLASTLRCRHCGRAVGDLIGYADQEIETAVFVPQENGQLPRYDGGQLRCARCRGQLFVDDVEVLGRNVSWEEVRGEQFAEVIRRARFGDESSAA